MGDHWFTFYGDDQEDYWTHFNALKDSWSFHEELRLKKTTSDVEGCVY